MPLNENELAFAQEVIRSSPAGVFTLKKLFGGKWDSIPKPRSYGMKFKETVKQGLLDGIAHHGLASNRADEYQVF